MTKQPHRKQVPNGVRHILVPNHCSSIARVSAIHSQPQNERPTKDWYYPSSSRLIAQMKPSDAPTPAATHLISVPPPHSPIRAGAIVVVGSEPIRHQRLINALVSGHRDVIVMSDLLRPYSSNEAENEMLDSDIGELISGSRPLLIFAVSSDDLWSCGVTWRPELIIFPSKDLLSKRLSNPPGLGEITHLTSMLVELNELVRSVGLTLKTFRSFFSLTFTLLGALRSVWGMDWLSFAKLVLNLLRSS